MSASSQGDLAQPTSMRSFLVLWLGQAFSVVGSGLTGFALGVWMFQKTAQATPFALTVLLSNLPRILLAPLAGSLVDRWNRRWLMILADTGDALVTLGALVLVLTGSLQVWHVYAIACVSAVFAAFQQPAYSASIALLVPKENLARANGLVQAAQAAESLLSPIVAGTLLGAVGLRGIFVADFATYFIAIAAALLVKIPQPVAAVSDDAGVAGGTRKRGQVWHDLVFGWRYLKACPGLLGLLCYFAFVNFLLNLSGVLISPMVLSFSDAATLGVIQMASGIGMLAGSLVISAWGGPKRRIAGVVGAVALAACGGLVMGLRPSALFVGLGIAWFLFYIPVAGGCSQAIFQSKVPPEKQGRVFAVRSMVASSMMPLASLLAGPLADRIFEPLMQADGLLGRGEVGRLLGMGPGRGIALIYEIASGLIVVASAIAWSDPAIRGIDEAPDDLVRQVNIAAPEQA